MTDVTDRRQAIVRAAFHQVATVGFEGLRLQQVAKDAGIDHSTLYHHFPGKKHIVAGIAEYAIGRFVATPPDGADAATTLRDHLRHLREVLAESPEVLVVTAELDLRARRDQVVAAVLERHESNWRRSLGELFAAGAAQGCWSDRVDPGSAVEMVIAVVKGVQLRPESAEAAFAQLDALLTTT
ncbi:TetR/AcrR family transcriptional regulator [Actinomycetes bacterium KLBMP 9759]